MPSRYRIMAILMVLVAAGGLAGDFPAQVGDPVTPIEAEPVLMEAYAAGEVEDDPTPVPAPASEMMQEIREVLETEKATLASLGVQLERAADHEAALATQKQVERTKQDTELQLLRIQADYARQEGRETQAAEIESAIERILNPPSRPNPVSRPAPRVEDIDEASTQN